MVLEGTRVLVGKEPASLPVAACTSLRNSSTEARAEQEDSEEGTLPTTFLWESSIQFDYRSWYCWVLFPTVTHTAHMMG